MREKFANRSLLWITEFYSHDKKSLERLKYGLEAFYSFITKTIGIIIISLFLGTFNETLLLIAFYGLLRSLAHGVHSSSNLGCWLVSIGMFGITPVISQSFNSPDLLKVLVIFSAFIAFLLYAPADTHKKPLVNSKKRLRGKLLSLVALLFLQVIILFSPNQIISNIALFALIFQIISIIPLTYKIQNLPYRNYKFYKKV